MTTDPVWTNAGPNTFILNLKNAKSDEIRIELQHVHRRGKGKFLGDVTLTWDNIISKDMSNEKVFFKLQKKETESRPYNSCVQGELGVRLWIKDV